MGSYAECWLGSFYVGSTKNDIDVGIMQLVRSSDKNIIRGKKSQLPIQMHRWTDHVDDDEEVSVVYFQVPIRVIRDRLELRGYTLAVAKHAFTQNLLHEAAQYKEWSEGEHGEIFQSIAQILATTDVDAWLSALREIRRKGLDQYVSGGRRLPLGDSLMEYMLNNDWYGYSGPDLNVALRLTLEVCDESDELIYDVTDLVLSEYFSAEDDLVEYALSLSSIDYSSNGKIIVLTEGRTDSWIISESLQLLYPHLADYFSFMDFEGGRVGGGVGNLANIVKAFAGAGIVNKIVALFDNDTAAEAAIQSLRSVRIPRNIKILKLPDILALQNYPTIGPSGLVNMNVNGMAASIELYFGVDVLTEETGELVPVQWTGFEAGLKKYQGEVLYKDRIQERFRRRIDICRGDPNSIEKTDWSGMREVLSTLFVVFHDVDEKEIRSQLDEYYTN